MLLYRSSYHSLRRYTVVFPSDSAVLIYEPTEPVQDWVVAGPGWKCCARVVKIRPVIVVKFPSAGSAVIGAIATF